MDPTCDRSWPTAAEVEEAWRVVARLVPMKGGAAAARRDGELVLIDGALLCEHRLNPSCAFLWEASDGVRTAEALSRLVEATFGIDAASARADVLHFIHEAVTRGVIQLRGELTKSRAGASVT